MKRIAASSQVILRKKAMNSILKIMILGAIFPDTINKKIGNPRVAPVPVRGPFIIEQTIL